MLSIKELKRFYPEYLHSHERFILREYLQYKILEIIFNSSFQDKLAFLGGTCLRIVYDNSRFSEDLDFDNFNFSYSDFISISEIIKTELEKSGFKVEIRNTQGMACHCYLRFPEILYNEGLTSHKDEKILIRIDSDPHHFNYKKKKSILNKFDVFTQINSTPMDILLAQKFYAVLNRKKNKGRDFFDIVFLLGREQVPNYDYLYMKSVIKTPGELRKRIIEKCTKLNLKNLAKEIRPFIFNNKDEKKVLLFPEYMEQVKLSYCKE